MARPRTGLESPKGSPTNLQRNALLVVASLVVIVGTLVIVALDDDTPVTTTTTESPAPPDSSTTTLPATSTTAPVESTVPPTTAATTTTTSTTTTSTTTSPPTSTTQSPSQEETLALASAYEMGDAWNEIFVIPYGPEDDRLGTSLGGDGEGFQIGPDYGAQAPDGTWWFLDAAKKRLAHFGETGEYLGDIAMKPGHLVNGQYFQFQLPRVLDDGTLVASRLSGTTSLLVVKDGEARLVSVPAEFRLRADNGRMLYGFGEDGTSLLRVDPATGAVDSVNWFRSRADTRYRIRIAGNLLTVEMPDANRRLDYRLAYAGDLSVPAYGMVEVTTGEDGSLFLFIIGGTDSGVGGQLAGFLAISPDGVAGPLEPSRNPFSNADPGSPAHLGSRPGTSTPWLMFVDTDGVHVYARTSVG